MMMSARQRLNFDEGWLFALSDSAQMAKADYHDASWRQLNLPHDWAIEGDFSADALSGASGGALPGGTAWYRKHFTIDKKDKYQQYYIQFDGVYMNSEVYLNGHLLGKRPYGYSSFEYEMTPYLLRGGDNVIAVRVNNSDQPNSRWYSGCGIYRHVWLSKVMNTHIAHWGLSVVPSLSDNQQEAYFVINSSLTVGQDDVSVSYSVIDRNNIEVGKVVAGKSGSTYSAQITVPHPHLWSPSSPYVYTVRADVHQGRRLIDSYSVTSGVRSIRFDAATGFWLNGKNIKINGVCQHHDMGCLGAALHEDALWRQLNTLRQMGANAIRCSHNPPAPELLNMCDTMGLMVMDESFDMWRRRKTKNDYARFFDEWAERDLTDMVLRDRNHPSIILWSIGNEVLEQWSSADADTLTAAQANLILNAGHDASTLAKDGEMSINSILTRRLADIVRRYDTSRPITAGCNEPSPSNHLFKSGALDVIGFNYHHQWIKDVPKNFPGKPFIMTESVSALQTRGNYMMPSDSIYLAPKEWWIPYTDPSFMCSAYDNMCASWGSTHEQTWDVVKHTPYVGGQFIWTGFDYIGEPTPYGFPARSSYFGIIDLAGFPKDVYYMYQSEWNDKQRVLHLFPHWNWLPGQQIDMWCYYNQADEVELFVNGQSQGVRRKADSHQYHVMWRVTYQPGEVKVVARQQGREVASQTIRTAGTPHHLRLIADRSSLRPDGRNLAFVQVEVVDADGNVCPWAEPEIYFTADGADIAGVDNGCQTSMERFKASQHKAFFGKCLVVLQSRKGSTSSVRLTARSIGLEDGMLTIPVSDKE